MVEGNDTMKRLFLFILTLIATCAVSAQVAIKATSAHAGY